MKVNRVLYATALLAALLLVSCGSDTEVVQPDPIVLDRPPIPEPTYYAGPVPDKSMEMVVASVELSNFVAAEDSIWSPWCCEEPGCDFSCKFYPTYPGGNRIRLVANNAIVTNEDSLKTDVYYGPSSTGEMLSTALSSRPYLEHVRYWRRIGIVERYSGSTSVTVTRSTTKGVQRTEAEEFGTSIGMEATASGGFFVDFSVTLRTELSYSSSTELSVSEEETVEESFTISCPENKNIVYCVWQLVDEFRIIGLDGKPFTDPYCGFRESSLQTVCPSSDFVPVTTYFD